MKKKLSDTKVGKLIATMFGQENLTLNEGKVQLTDEQRSQIKERFGEEFLSKLESTTFDKAASLEESTTLFEAAVAGVSTQKDEIIRGLQAKVQDLQQVVNTLSAEPEPTPQATAVQPAAKNAGFKIVKTARHNAAVIAALTSGNPANFNLEGGIDITDLQQEFAMAMPQGAKLDLFLKRIYNGFPDAQYMTQRLSKGRDFIGASAIMGEVSQQFTNRWTPKGTTKFTPLEIKYRRHKINVEIDPTEVIDSWLIDLYQQGKTPDQQPLVLYIITNHILPKVTEDITFSMIGKGKYVKVTGAKTGDEGSAAVNSMDGYETILVEGKTTGAKFNYYKNPQNVLQLTGQALLDYVDKFTKAISPLFAKNLPVYCSREFLEAYKKADYDVYGKYTGTEIGNQVRFSKFTLIALDSMYNSPILFATPKENFIQLVDLAKADSCINDIQKSDYVVKIFGEYSLSCGFAIAEAVFASVPDGYVPSEVVLGDNSYGDSWEHGSGAEAAEAGEVEGA